MPAELSGQALQGLMAAVALARARAFLSRGVVPQITSIVVLCHKSVSVVIAVALIV